MFKNLKEKVKKGSTSNEFSVVLSTPVHSKRASTNEESKSTSSKLTEDSTADTNNLNDFQIDDSLVEEESSSAVFNNHETPTLNSDVLELTREKNEHLAEKIKFQTYNESLLDKIEHLNNEIKEKESEIESYRMDKTKLYEDLDEYKQIFKNFESDIATLRNDKDDLIIKNAELSQKLELLKLVNHKQENNSLGLKRSSNVEIIVDGEELGTEDASRREIETLENSEALKQHLEDNRSLRADLNEKNKVIKNLQQRLNDMKKTLQRELNYKNIQLPNEKSVGKSHSEQQQTMNFSKSSTSLIALSQLNSKRNQSHLDMPKKESLDTSVISLKPKVNGHLTNLHDDVNFKYLKHVVLKFLCSKEYEALHLIKALSVLLNFSNDEEKILKETLEWKMSWFGTRPKIQ